MVIPETKNEIAEIIYKHVLKLFEITKDQRSINIQFPQFINVFEIQRHLTINTEGNEHITFLDGEYEDRIFKSLFQSHVKQKFYHYTTVPSVFSMIQSQKLQFSSIAGMNDKSETDFVDNLLKKEFKNPLNAKRIEAFNRR